MMQRRQFLRLTAGAVGLPIASQHAWAQTYPTRPVRLVVGAPPGGVTDVFARLVGHWLSERLGQQFVIENRPGAGTNIGTEAVVRASADGYTLLMVSVSNAYNATLYENLTFDFIRDIAPVAGVMRGTGVLVVHPSVPAGPSLNSSSMPRQIRASSIWHQVALELANTSTANCSNQ